MSTLNTVNITNGTDSITVEGAVKGSAKAWVNFNGTGVVAIRASFNVSSITDNGTGDYTVNFTTAMPDANYAAVGMNSGTGSPNRAVAQALDTTPVAGSARIKSFSTSSAVLTDEVNINVAVFR